MAASTNSYYGFNRILAEYAGLSAPPPIFGYLQHGWHHGWPPWFDDELHFSRLPKWIPKLMWSQADVETIERAGVTNARAVGSPFLYLLRMHPPAPPPGDGSLLCFPFHASEIGAHATSWSEYAEYLRERSGGGRVTICLHYMEYAQSELRSMFEGLGFEVTTNGTLHDPAFLRRLATLIECHDAVTTNRLGTAIVYAGAVGRPIDLGGPLAGLTVDSHGRPLDTERERMEAYQRERYPELVGGLDGPAARRLALAELGEADMLQPDRLCDALGWRGARRVAARGLAAAAAVRRRLSGEAALDSSRTTSSDEPELIRTPEGS